MPKRIVDGEALWMSGKLKRVPVAFRLHYANWIPLAEANGVFEVDFDIIRSRVYPILCPEFSTEDVQGVFTVFVRSGLLHTWKDSGKDWAYFIGMEKPGRLPGEKHVSRYKHLPPPPPGYIPDTSGKGPDPDRTGTGPVPEGLGLGLGFGLGVGIGLVEEEDMNIKNALTDKAREILGVRISPQDNNWPEIKALVRVYGDEAVTGKFEQWAKSQTQIPNYPLSGFIRIADGLLSGKFSSSVSPEILSSLVNDLVAISDGRVLFNNNQKQALAGLLADHLSEDVRSAFSEFWGNIENDDFAVRQAAKTFTEAAEQLLAVQSRRREKERQTQELLRASTENEQKIAREEAEARLKAEVELQNLIEDTL
jgi:hypothetical protein